MENYILEKIYGKLYSGKNLWKTIFWKKFMENYILEKIYGNARNGLISAIGFSGSADEVRASVAKL